ncbi:hypothetical protein [Cupriavidus sp. BIC8F]|uniref:hypothetical protein n=1 Tax=Cupriavidus sp. BIC8F TaxID=3079014 RepID=UPI0029166F16|nr:hypothetical protein [Cupriavidus sp. BIC8F]
MKVGTLLLLLGGAAIGIAPGSIHAIQLGGESMQGLSSSWWLQCGEEPVATLHPMGPAVDHEWEIWSLYCAAQRDKATLQYALAVNPRHRLFKHDNSAAAPSKNPKPKPSRDAKRQDLECGQPSPTAPQ